jgi:pyrroloquinoline quinone biosynthesis protein E
MLPNDKEYRRTYGQTHDMILAEARRAVENPAQFRTRVEAETASAAGPMLRAPQADPFSYRMRLYSGFLRFPERLRNYIVAKHEPRSAHRASLPIMLDIEPVSRCNFRCVMCTMSQWEGGKRAEDLDVATFARFIRDHREHLVEVKLQGVGEPLLHPGFFDMVRLAADEDIWVRTTVNGSLLHCNDNTRRLLDSGIGEVQTSFDGADRETYAAIRRGADFDRIVANLTALNAYANTKDRPFTRMWVLVQKANRGQIFRFVELALRMGFHRMTFSLGIGDWGKESWRDTVTSLSAGHLTDEEQGRLAETATREGLDITVWGATEKYSARTPQTLCAMPFTRGFVGSDWRIAPCGGIGNPDVHELGDARELAKAWNGPVYTAFRQDHLDGRIPECCRNCYELPASPEAA